MTRKREEIILGKRRRFALRREGLLPEDLNIGSREKKGQKSRFRGGARNLAGEKTRKLKTTGGNQ